MLLETKCFADLPNSGAGVKLPVVNVKIVKIFVGFIFHKRSGAWLDQILKATEWPDRKAIYFTERLMKRSPSTIINIIYVFSKLNRMSLLKCKDPRSFSSPYLSLNIWKQKTEAFSFLKDLQTEYTAHMSSAFCTGQYLDSSVLPTIYLISAFLNFPASYCSWKAPILPTTAFIVPKNVETLQTIMVVGLYKLVSLMSSTNLIIWPQLP